MCDDNDSILCPYHAATAQLLLLAQVLGDDMSASLDAPFFPNDEGCAVSTVDFIELVERIAVARDLELLAVDGGNAYGGHVW